MNEDPNKSSAEDADSIEKILTEYGGRLSEVPDARLERLGYITVETEGGTRIMKISAYKTAQKEKQESLERIPFDTLNLEFESETRTGLLHSIDFNSLETAMKRQELLLHAHEQFGYGNDTKKMHEFVYGTESKLHKLHNLAQQLSDQGRIPMIAEVNDPRFVVDTIFADIYYGSLSNALISHDYHKVISELEELICQLKEAVEDQDDYDEYDEDEEIDQHLQYLSGKFGDPDIYSPKLAEELSAQSNDGKWWSEDYQSEEKISSFDVLKNILKVIAADLEATDLVESIKNAESLEELRGMVNTIAPITTRQTELQAGIKDKTLDPRKVSGELAALKAKRKETQAILEAIDEMTRLPTLQAEIVRKQIEKIRSKIYNDVESGHKKRHHFSFDAKPDSVLDKDPGAVSGDCTEGKPLPFGRKDIGVFNVKVRDSKDEHVGNIYLLETELGDNYGERSHKMTKGHPENQTTGIEVWHLDAIQIISGAQWDSEAIEKFFSTLNEAAEKKGVKGITMNTGRDFISNHRSISEPFLAWLRDNPDVIETNVIIPEVQESDIVSSFQSMGLVFFVPNKLYTPDV